MSHCDECASSLLVHDDDLGSLVCTECGTLADPSQAVLAANNDAHNTTRCLQLPPRTSKGWLLAQTKQDRDRKHMIAMSTFIASVLSKLNNPGLSPRAEAIFTQAMTKGKYRWGRRAKRTAGASIAIALREAHRSDSLRDIAFLIDDSPVSLARAFQSVVSLLDFSLTSTDPAVHLPILHAYLHSLIHPETLSPSPASHLPTSLVSILSPLSFQAAVRTATLLSQIVSHHVPPLPIASLPTPPTACALLILGLEAERRAPLPHLKELSRTLAARFALSSAVVSSRYKVLYDLIEEWIRHVPWLDHFKDRTRRASARSKLPKRTIVAKGIQDAIQFHHEIWQSRMQSQHKVNLELVSESEDEHDDENANGSSSNAPPPTKRRKRDEQGNAVRAVYRRLLDPVSSGALGTATFSDDVSLLSHLLTCSPDELVRAQCAPPTRLQLLTASRGGSTAEHIADEELFANGELEGLLRNEHEREAFLPLFQLNWSEDTVKEDAAIDHRPVTAETKKRGAERIDMDALSRLLGGRVDDDEEDAVCLVDPDEFHAYQYTSDDDTQCSSEHQITTKDAEVVSDWRPEATDDDDGDIFGAFDDVTPDRYEEEV